MRTSRDLAVWLLAFALVGAQALGLAHRVLHGAQPAGVASVADAGDLFAGHEAQSTCPLFDQLAGSAITPAVPVLCLPVIPHTFFIAFIEGEALARWSALFDARGPPTLR